MLFSNKTHALMIALLIAAVIIGGCSDAQAPVGPDAVVNASSMSTNSRFAGKSLSSDSGIDALDKWSTLFEAVMSLAPGTRDVNIMDNGGTNVAGRPCGDINGDGGVNILDVIDLRDYYREASPFPIKPETGDVDTICGFNWMDVKYLWDYIYEGGMPPVCPQDKKCFRPER